MSLNIFYYGKLPTSVLLEIFTSIISEAAKNAYEAVDPKPKCLLAFIGPAGVKNPIKRQSVHLELNIAPISGQYCVGTAFLELKIPSCSSKQVSD